MITREEAEQIAERWVRESAPAGKTLTARVHEFDLGYVVWAQPRPDDPPLIGAGRGIIDRATGETSVWPSLPVEMVIKRFREKRALEPPAPRTWDPAEQARWDLRHVATPATVSHLRLVDRVLVARSIKGDQAPRHHRLVDEFLASLAPEYRERGFERCSEAAALSDALHAEDARRTALGSPEISLADARSGLFGGAQLVTYRVREPGDPVAGESAPPCISCAMLERHFGFEVLPPGVGSTERPGESEPNV